MDNPVWLLVTSAYAVLATWLVCLLSEDLGKRWKLMDNPGERKAHARPTPLAGGIALLVLIVPIMPVIGMLFQPDDVGNKALAIIAFATIVSALIGISDDRHSLSATVRLLMSVALFALAMWLDPRFLIERVWFSWSNTTYVLPTWLSWLFTLTALVGFINAVNMADGKNGLVIGLSLCWAILLTAIGPSGLVIVMLPIVLMLCVLLIYNVQGRLFLGDGGAYGLAAFFGLVAVYVYNLGESAISADLVTLFFAVPGIDMLRLFVWRILSGRSPTGSDRDHFHHHMLALFGWPKGLVVYLGMIIVPGCAATLLPDSTALWLGAVIGLYALLLVAGKSRAKSIQLRNNPDATSVGTG